MITKRLVTLAVIAAASVTLAGCPDPHHGSTKPPKPVSSDTRFKDSCRLKGGTPVITRRNGQSQYNCVLPPAGGWS
jgi:hypothetical protein